MIILWQQDFMKAMDMLLEAVQIEPQNCDGYQLLFPFFIRMWVQVNYILSVQCCQLECYFQQLFQCHHTPSKAIPPVFLEDILPNFWRILQQKYPKEITQELIFQRTTDVGNDNSQ